MKRTLIAALICMCAVPAFSQQDSLVALVIANVKENGGQYKLQQVVSAPGSSATALYLRAVEVLSDGVGPDGQSKYNLDVSDKESGTVIYKGKIYTGFFPVLLAGYHTYADFTLKIRCKDEKAQITLLVPQISSIDTNPHARVRQGSTSLTDIIWRATNGKGAKQKRCLTVLATLQPKCADLVDALFRSLSAPTDDDF